MLQYLTADGNINSKRSTSGASIGLVFGDVKFLPLLLLPVSKPSLSVSADLIILTEGEFACSITATTTDVPKQCKAHANKKTLVLMIK